MARVALRDVVDVRDDVRDVRGEIVLGDVRDDTTWGDWMAAVRVCSARFSDAVFAFVRGRTVCVVVARDTVVVPRDVVSVRDGAETRTRGAVAADDVVARRFVLRDAVWVPSAATAWKTSGARHAAKNNRNPFIPY